MSSRDPIATLDWSIDRTSREIVRGDRRVRLADKPFRVLEALVEARGGVVTRESLRKRLWSDDTFVDFDNNLNSAVATLRQVLGDSARAPRYIETLPKVGYRLRGTAEATRFRSRAARSLALTAALVLVASTMFRVDPEPTSTPAVPAAQRALERGLYLRAQFQGGREEPGLLTRAREAFAAARREDARFARAAAEEAETLLQMSFEGMIGFRNGLELAREAAGHALDLEPSNGTGLRAMGMTALFLDWDFERARTYLARAAVVDRLDARTALAEATLFAAEGRHQAAVRLAERAVALDPAAYYVRADLALFYLAAGRNEEAAASTERVLDVVPDFAPALSYSALAYERLGRWSEAAEAARSFMRLQGADEEDRARVDAAGSREAVALFRKWDLERIEALATGRAQDFALHLALRYAAAGEHAAALEHLERAYQRHDALLIFLAAFPELAVLRGDARFEELSSRIRRS